MVILTGLAIYSLKPVPPRQTATNETGTDEETIRVPTDQVNFKSTEVTIKVTVDDPVLVDDLVSEDVRTIDHSKGDSASVNQDLKHQGDLPANEVAS